MSAKLGAVLLRAGPNLVYVPAAVAVRLASIPPVTRIPGAPDGLLGVALHEGEIIPIISIGGARDSMLVCAVPGGLLGVVGAIPVATGIFDVAPDGVSLRWAEETAAVLDPAAAFARMAPPSWGGVWGG
jgi:hypothetical protein